MANDASPEVTASDADGNVTKSPPPPVGCAEVGCYHHCDRLRALYRRPQGCVAAEYRRMERVAGRRSRIDDVHADRRRRSSLPPYPVATRSIGRLASLTSAFL